MASNPICRKSCSSSVDVSGRRVTLTRSAPVSPEAAAVLKKRTLTNLYNERPAWLDNAHRELDAAVAAAYGWPAGISEEGRAVAAPQPRARRRWAVAGVRKGIDGKQRRCAQAANSASLSPAENQVRDRIGLSGLVALKL
jgi:hypothetical protein